MSSRSALFTQISFLVCKAEMVNGWTAAPWLISLFLLFQGTIWCVSYSVGGDVHSDSNDMVWKLWQQIQQYTEIHVQCCNFY